MINHEARNITVCHFIHDNYLNLSLSNINSFKYQEITFWPKFNWCDFLFVTYVKFATGMFEGRLMQFQD